MCVHICYNPSVIDIKQLREKLGWSQDRLARELGVANLTVRRWEKNGVKPNPAHQEKLDKLAQE